MLVMAAVQPQYGDSFSCRSGCCVTPPRLTVTIYCNTIRPASVYTVTSREIDGVMGNCMRLREECLGRQNLQAVTMSYSPVLYPWKKLTSLVYVAVTA